MKKLYIGLLLSLGGSLSILSGQILAEWPLISAFQGNPQSVATGISASALQRGNGIGSLQYTALGVSSRSWYPGTSKGEVDYYEVCLTPNSGENMLITGIAFSEKRTAEGIRAFELWYSMDGFVTATRLDSTGLPDNESWRSYSLSGLDIRSYSGRAVCFRWYGFRSETSSGEWQLKDQSLKVYGQVLAPCSAPTEPGLVSVTNVGTTTLSLSVSGGDAGAKLVAMRKGAAVSAMPCRGQFYTPQAVFGAGASLSEGEYVVGLVNGTNGNLTVSGLEEGATYHLAVFAYHPAGGGYCYQQTNIARSSASTPCSGPGAMVRTRVSAGSGQAGILWDMPHCYDEVVVFASTQPFNNMPSGQSTNYQANPVFGLGTPTLATGVYPIYRGTADQLNLSGLSNGGTYYVRVFVRLGNTWSAGPLVEAEPAPGCADLNGDVLFMNEFHYDNGGTDDIDEGIELAGPAGLDLSVYDLVLYRRLSGAICQVYRTQSLSGVLDNENGSGYGAVWIPLPGIEDNTGAVAIYNRAQKRVVQFWGYRNPMTAQDGPAQGLTSNLIANPIGSGQGAYETSGTQQGVSIQLTGSSPGGGALCPSDFTWLSDQPMSMGSTNAQQLVLPIELLSFQAKLSPYKEVELSWTTAYERNNDFMVVEHSTDARTFTEVGRLPGAGDSSSPQYYRLWHTKPQQGINYYRLKQVDYDGQYAYHGPIALTLSGLSAELQVSPNPFVDQVTLNWPEGATRLIVQTMTGQVITDQQLDGTTAGTEQFSLGHLPTGLYWLKVELNGTWQLHKLVKAR